MDADKTFGLSLQITYQELLVQEQLEGFFFRLLREATENLRVVQHSKPHCPQLTPSVVHSGHVGRPKF